MKVLYFLSIKTIIMQVITIEIIHDKALQLLQNLEDLNLIRLVDEIPLDSIPSEASAKSRFAGRISAETAAALHLQLQQMREEWET